MPYEFRGENLVYVEPPETAGYTWTSSGGGIDTAPTEKWVANEGFNPASLLTGRVDKYGRVDYSARPDLTEAEQRAYNLAYGGYSPNDYTVKETGANVGITPENIRSSGWWDIDPAIQNRIESEYAKNSGNAVGMVGFKDWVVPLSILAAGAGAAIGGGALAGEAAAGAAGGEAGAAGGFGLNPASTGGVGLNAGNASGLMATQSAAGLGGAGTGIIEGLAPTSIGMGGTAGAGSLAGIAGTEAAAGLGSLGTGLSAEQLAAYESANPGMSAKDVLTKLNQARQIANAGNSISKLLSPSGQASTGSTGLNLGSLANALRAQTQTNDYLGQYKMNQNPFTFTPQGQTVASEGMYDVSGSNMANALRKA